MSSEHRGVSLSIDEKINKLISITDQFIFPEYYIHEDAVMWKIKNEYTKYNEHKVVLCRFDEGIEKALDVAIKYITEEKENFSKNRLEVEFTDFAPNTNWCSGKVGEYTFEAKLFDVGSNFGINKGRVSILSICSEEGEIIHYSRGWDIEPTLETTEVFEAVLNFLENTPKRFE